MRTLGILPSFCLFIVSLEVLKNKDMATSDLKKRVLEYVQEADEPLLQLMETVAQNYNKEAES